ncbi:GFA family protein [Pararhodobacter zhoushanensis]|uniref:GFA family protein n=1 Tax=Pararhodobacter zhoushanensis TaxID=2479545 RepID=A0ABT3H4H2_9RHOB|nr:GFA family protein [Pararhodobacter zhoushanensis]MCW1934681.1 GFA family protein [Pararhodobacter zhoushanensis]
MTKGFTDHPAFRGGCQCGAVRYAVAAGPAKDSVCHCRMCQRATGNAFAPLVEVKADRVRWEGTPREWASSTVAWRGFCATCGTPLYYRSGDSIELMAGTLAPGTGFAPVSNTSVESRVDWLPSLTGPGHETSPALIAKVQSFQAPEEG